MKTISMLAAVSAVAAVTLSVPARSGQVDALARIIHVVLKKATVFSWHRAGSWRIS